LSVSVVAHATGHGELGSLCGDAHWRRVLAAALLVHTIVHTVVAAPSHDPIAMKIPRQVHESRIVLHDVPWGIYQDLRANNDGLRMTYDSGELEIMSPSRKHESVSYRIGLMIYEWTMLHRIAGTGGRNTTLSREDLLKGLEPDDCYWIANCAAVLDKEEIDLRIDPPPDLALEVDVSRSSIPKLPIYRSLGVPEVWRWRRGTLEVLALDAGNNYVAQPRSTVLPGFPLQLVEEFLEARGEDDMALMHRFRKTIADMPPPE
jgi:Uma2 family endonuclease